MVRRGRQFSWRRLQPYWATIQTTLILFAALFVFTSGAFATVVSRLQDRSLFINNAEPGARSSYTISFRFNTISTVGSIDFLFCVDPIPNNSTGYHPCIPPAGLDVSSAVLSNQVGESGFNIAVRSSNHITLSRTPAVVGAGMSSYTFDNILNPTSAAVAHSYAIRLSTYASTDTSGPIIDLGSVLTQVTNDITLETQVPPMLIFCVAATVSQDCGSSAGGNYSDMGDLSPSSTLTATSQMAVGTNASNGFVITANGPTMEAGANIINSLSVPTPSAPGNSQFGINLVANTVPAVGSDPDGAFTNAVVNPNYAQQNQYAYNDGDEVALSPSVSLVRRYTVSYIVNAPPTLRPGVYTTTITYICTGRF